MPRSCPVMLAAAALVVAGCTPPPPTHAPPPRTPAPQAAQPPANPNPQPPTPRTPPPQDPPPPPPPAPPPPDKKPNKPSREETEKQRLSLVEVKFGRLDETTVDKKPFYSINIELKNATDKEIKKLNGGLSFYDEAGKTIYVFGYIYDTPLKSGESRKAGFPVVTIEPASVAYMKEHPDKVKVEFEADTIEYADGTKAKFR